MDIVQECRYLYRIPAGSGWYVEERYGCCMAVSMADAKKHIHRAHRGVPIYRVRLGREGCEAADSGTQEYRKALYDFAAMKMAPKITH